ncbi:calcineurin [Nannocystis pusilla]|uniref:Calcineurin n=1 Tax=Nannocystis pusilla TaxID=889268 RepID=A0A9X3ESV3_9BACT|nr:calcineurin [Nannocystis pusilla]MCY1004863.1 calcineurin [Nannocystis pusilla]
MSALVPRSALALALVLSACGGDTKTAPKTDEKKVEAKAEAKEEPATDAAKKPRPRAPASEKSRVADPKGRVVVVGSLNGDLAATKAALKTAGAIDDAGKWTGGDLVVVQLGNQFGNNKDEKATLALLDDLAAQAQAAGGALYRLTGENEILNVALNFKDIVHAQGFKDYAKEKSDDPRVESLPANQRGRAAVFASGGPVAKKLSEQKLILVAGDSAFAHAGLLGEHIQKGIDNINDESTKWMLGEIAMMPDMLAAPGPARTLASAATSPPARSSSRPSPIWP